MELPGSPITFTGKGSAGVPGARAPAPPVQEPFGVDWRDVAARARARRARSARFDGAQEDGGGVNENAREAEHRAKRPKSEAFGRAAKRPPPPPPPTPSAGRVHVPPLRARSRPPPPPPPPSFAAQQQPPPAKFAEAKPGFAALLRDGRLTYYELLGVPPNATERDIAKAFRALSKTTHPDHNSAPTATEDFQALKRVYDTLKSPVARLSYNAALRFRRGRAQ